MRWQVNLLRPGLGGVAATQSHVVFGDRDADDLHDVWRCLDASSGEILWEVKVLAIGALDYGNSPRTTPLLTMVGDDADSEARAFLLGAMGDLICVRLATGETLWRKNLATTFGAQGRARGDIAAHHCWSTAS